jgi:O-antigen ligase
MHRKTRLLLLLFCFVHLFLACTIRSGIIVDRSFIPRFGLLAVLLLVSWFAIKGWISIRNNFFEFAFIFFYLWSLLSALWSINASEAILQSQLVFLALSLFLIVSALVLKYPGFELIFIKTHLLVLLFSFGLAFFKMANIEYYDPYKIVSVSANNNLYAGFLLISLPIVISGYSLCKKSWKYVSVLTGILAFFFIIIIQSRAVYLGVLIALIICFVLIVLRYRTVIIRRNIITGIISVVMLAIAVFIFMQTLDITRRKYFLEKIRVWEYFQSYDELQAKNVKRLHESDRDNHTKMAEFDFSEDYYSNANLRLIFWKKSLGLIKEQPVTGVGAGNWRLAVASVAEPPNPEHTIGNCTYSEPHNEWIRILAELGIVGLLLAVFLFFLPPVIVLYRILFASNKPPLEALIYVSFIVGFYLFASFDFPLRRVEHNIIFWSVFAFMLSKVGLPEFGNGFLLRPSKGLSVLFLMLILFSILLSFARFRGEYYTILMFRNERKDDKKEIIYCHKAENALYHITPNTLPVSWFEGVAHYRLGDFPLADSCFIKALKYTPYEVRALNDYSVVLYKLEKTGEAIKTLKETLVIDPFFDEARFNLGAMYYLTGQPANAREQILQCRESQRKQDFLNEIK